MKGKTVICWAHNPKFFGFVETALKMGVPVLKESPAKCVMVLSGSGLSFAVSSVPDDTDVIALVYPETDDEDEALENFVAKLTQNKTPLKIRLFIVLAEQSERISNLAKVDPQIQIIPSNEKSEILKAIMPFAGLKEVPLGDAVVTRDVQVNGKTYKLPEIKKKKTTSELSDVERDRLTIAVTKISQELRNYDDPIEAAAVYLHNKWKVQISLLWQESSELELIDIDSNNAVLRPRIAVEKIAWPPTGNGVLPDSLVKTLTGGKTPPSPVHYGWETLKKVCVLNWSISSQGHEPAQSPSRALVHALVRFALNLRESSWVRKRRSA